MTSTNYTGRKVDLSIFPETAFANIPVEANLALGSRAVAGPLALSQAFAVALLTPLGHYRSDPNYGSTLMADLTEKRVEFPSDIQHAFALATISVIGYFDRAWANHPDDEKIATVALDTYNIRGTVIELSVILKTVAGPTAVFLLPVQWSS